MKTHPPSLFFNTSDQRIALARQRYFEEGVPPSGSINSAIFESWSRCLRLGVEPRMRVEFNEVTNSRAQLARQKHRTLLDAWSAEAVALEKSFAGTSYSAVLTDDTGVLIACLGEHKSPESITNKAHRVGVSLSEEAVGTTAPGLALKTGQVVAVRGGEHFFDSVSTMYCAAAPIRNTEGAVAGVLNISSEGAPFGFHAAALVSMYATSIENRFLVSESDEQIVMRVQLNPSLLDTPMVGLIGLSYSGKIMWANQVAAQLINPNLQSDLHSNPPLSEVFDTNLEAFLFCSDKAPREIRLTNGLSIWAQASGAQASSSFIPHAHARSVAKPAQLPSNAPPPSIVLDAESNNNPVEHSENLSANAGAQAPSKIASLRESNVDLILSVVQEFNGNISKAARKLGVSRGLIYRRLKEESQKA